MSIPPNTKSPLVRAMNASHVAVFGASTTPGKFGYVVVDRLLQDGFSDRLTLVNPRGGTLFGRRLEPDTAAARADLAIVCTPASFVPGIIQKCADLEIPVAAVLSAGFAEEGQRDLNDELRKVIAASGIRVLGPNCLGVLNRSHKMNLTTVDLPSGPVCYIGQSGGVGTQVARRLGALGSGLDLFFSLGNKADVGFADCLETLASRESGGVVMYLERFDEGDRFLEVLSRVARRIPVIALLAGRTGAGRLATQSHTGSVLPSWERAAALLKSAGATIVDEVGLAAAAALSAQRASRAVRSVFVVSGGGGSSVLLADALSQAGFELPLPGSVLQPKLEFIFGHRRSTTNPVEFAGLDYPEIYAKTLEAVVGSGEADAAVIGGIFGGYTLLFGDHLAEREMSAANRIAQLATEWKRPVVMQTEFATVNSAPLAALRAAGVACVEWPEEAVLALTSATGHRPAKISRSTRGTAVIPHASDAFSKLTESVLRTFKSVGIRHGLGERVTRSMLPVNEPGPWVLRLDGFPHKARSNALKLRVSGADLTSAFDDLVALAEMNRVVPRVRVHRFIPHEHELLVSLWRSSMLGDGWVVGRGGASVEENPDIFASRLPKSESDVIDGLGQTAIGARVLSTDRDLALRFSEMVMRLAACFETNLSNLTELELNPVALGPDVTVLDLLAET